MDLKKKNKTSLRLPATGVRKSHRKINLSGLVQLPQRGNQMGSLLNPAPTYCLISISPFLSSTLIYLSWELGKWTHTEVAA